MGTVLSIYRLLQPFAVPACAVLLVMLVSVRCERDRLYNELYEPETGYIARYNQCTSNVDTLEGAIETQNESIRLRAEAGQRATEEAQARVDALEIDLQAAIERGDDLLNRPLAPPDQSCDRALELIRSINP